jgi:hypothetical protein
LVEQTVSMWGFERFFTVRRKRCRGGLENLLQ